ncbi:MAG: TetR/AcrR family transcriptional regulator [Oscillospiraceae bacterium]
MAPSKANGFLTSHRRQKQIEDCLYTNLLHRPYTSVSVSDLCHQLEISRKSFYNYFPDKDTCFRSLISRKLRQCSLAVTVNRPKDATLEDRLALLMEYWKQERAFLDILVRNGLLVMLIDQCIRFLREEDKLVLEYLNTPQLKTDEYVLACYVNVQITMILQWHKGNYEIPVEEMVRKYKRLIYEPLLSL